jgi:hypothetical protein
MGGQIHQILALTVTGVASPTVQDVRCVTCGASAWEWVLMILGALTGLLGGTAAVGALILAKRSAGDAELSLLVAQSTAEASQRSADASARAASSAERSESLSRELSTHVSQQLEMQREQFKHFMEERAKKARPRLDLHRQEESTTGFVGIYETVIRVTLENQGVRDLRAALNLWAPPRPLAHVWLLDGDGKREQIRGTGKREVEIAGDDYQAACYRLGDVELTPQECMTAKRVLVALTKEGEWPFAVEVRDADADPAQCWEGIVLRC